MPRPVSEQAETLDKERADLREQLRRASQARERADRDVAQAKKEQELAMGLKDTDTAIVFRASEKCELLTEAVPAPPAEKHALEWEGAEQETEDGSTDEHGSDVGLDGVHARLQDLAHKTLSLTRSMIAERAARSEEVSAVRAVAEEANERIGRLGSKLADFSAAFDKMLSGGYCTLSVARKDLRQAIGNQDESAAGFDAQLPDPSHEVACDANAQTAQASEMMKLAAALAEVKGQVVAQRVECRDEASRARLMAEESVAHAEKLANILFQASSALDKRLSDQLDTVQGELRQANQKWAAVVESFEGRFGDLRQGCLGQDDSQLENASRTCVRDASVKSFEGCLEDLRQTKCFEDVSQRLVDLKQKCFGEDDSVLRCLEVLPQDELPQWPKKDLAEDCETKTRKVEMYVNDMPPPQNDEELWPGPVVVATCAGELSSGVSNVFERANESDQLEVHGGNIDSLNKTRDFLVAQCADITETLAKDDVEDLEKPMHSVLARS